MYIDKNMLIINMIAIFIESIREAQFRAEFSRHDDLPAVERNAADFCSHIGA